MSNPAHRILPRIEATREELLAFVDGLDEAVLAWHPPGGGWSIRENLAHLADAEHGHRRFAQAVLAGQPVRIEGFDLDRWNEERVARREGQSVGEILDALRAERQETLALVSTIPPGAWEKRGDHPALGELSVQQVIKVIGVHERMHLREMRQLLEASEM